MLISDAQRDVRQIYAGGFHGQVVSGLVWLVAAALGTWSSSKAGIVALLVGGTLIFPLTSLAIRLAGGASSLPARHPMSGLATQVAFTVPIGLIVALGAAAHRLEWFFPAAMLIVGAHYLPFVFLYGMRLFAGLAAALVMAGLALGLWFEASFATGGWLGGALLIVFAVLLRRSFERESERSFV